MEVDAVAGNWNGGIEWDGIVLRVWPLDQWGKVIPVSGTLEVTLIAERGYGDRPDQRRDPVQEIGHWTRSIRPSSYGSDGAAVRLEYQNYHPEPRNSAGTDRWHVRQAHSDWLIGPHGEVSVRMAIPGHGVFSSTTGQVRLRRFSPTRDRYFDTNGTRFLPFE